MTKLSLKTGEINSVFNVLNSLSLKPLDNDSIAKILGLKKKMRPIVKEYNDFVEDARKAVLTKEVEQALVKSQEKQPLNEKESGLIKEAEAKLNAILMSELAKVNELEVELLPESLLVTLIKECDLPQHQDELIYFLFE